MVVGLTKNLNNEKSNIKKINSNNKIYYDLNFNNK